MSPVNFLTHMSHALSVAPTPTDPDHLSPDLSQPHPIRPFYPGLGEAVARRTYLRPDEQWAELVDRVTIGNWKVDPFAHTVSLRNRSESGQRIPSGPDEEGLHIKRLLSTANAFNRLMRKGIILTSGRHQEHGDATQPTRHMEVFTNCSTAASSSVKFYLLLCGSGVGRAYDDDLMLVDWRNAPTVECLLDADHPDNDGSVKSYREVGHQDYALYHRVADSREGWAYALMLVEGLAYGGNHRDRKIALDFSDVRCQGSPIAGMQNKPASGPEPLIKAFQQFNQLVQQARLMGWMAWEQTLRIDHVFAACVLFGGARRSARIATKYWKDAQIDKFIQIKQDGGLWSANNSVAVDQDFYDDLDNFKSHAEMVMRLATLSAYYFKTGEPGFINVHKLNDHHAIKNDKRDPKTFKIGSSRFQLTRPLQRLYAALVKLMPYRPYQYICNPCGEILLHILGAFCVILDICMMNADTWDELQEACDLSPMFLMRVNTMDNIYEQEVKLTNRIGIGLTGIHEWAAKCGLSWDELLDEQNPHAQVFWARIRVLKLTVEQACERDAAILGVNIPRTNTTIKPSGSVSKPWNCSEGAGLPEDLFWMRWVQYDKLNPLLDEYRKRGYPTRDLKSYPNTVIVGFPTRALIRDYLPAEKVVTAGQASIQEHYQWVRLLEANWLTPNGGQVSYTCKYEPGKTTYQMLYDTIRQQQRTVRCFSIHPRADESAYEYQPNESLSQAAWAGWVDHINTRHRELHLPPMMEDIDLEHLICTGGACPIL